MEMGFTISMIPGIATILYLFGHFFPFVFDLFRCTLVSKCYGYYEDTTSSDRNYKDSVLYDT